MADEVRPLQLPSRMPSQTLSLPTFGLLGLCVAMGYLGYISRRPYNEAARIHQVNRALEAEVMDLKIKNEQIGVEAAQLGTDRGQERQLRRNGFTKPGEIPMIVLDK
ncbi:MAG: hypothetical protein ABJA67_05590 [Chthonomonadales bacterium]